MKKGPVEANLEPDIFGGQRIAVKHGHEVENKAPLPNGHVLGCIVGASGTGKSTIVCSLIPKFGHLTQVMVFSKVIGNAVYDAVEQYCDSQGIQYGFASDPEEGAELIERFIEQKGPEDYSLTIFDDFSRGNSQSREEPHNRLQNTVFQVLRNYRNHALVISQSYTGVPTLVRNNTVLQILFRMRGEPSTRSAATDFENMTGIPAEVFRQLYAFVQKEPHGFLMCNARDIFLYLPEQLKDNPGGQVVSSTIEDAERALLGEKMP